MRVLNEGALLANRYTLRRRLGAGGMAEVWLADDRQADAPVALKFLAADLAGEDARRDAFRREWRIGSNLMHAHIVRVFEYHDETDGPFYSLQYLGGSDLSTAAGHGPEEALRPVGLIADALRYAHAKGVVHRDIKAANVLLDSRGAPCLADFGVAAIEGEASAPGGGSAINQSPEQQAGDPPQPADDIYALGVLIHELLTGRPRAGAGTAPDALADGSPVPTAVRELLRDMLAADAALRPSAEQVAARLREAGFAPGPVSAARLGAMAEPAAADTVEAIRPVSHARPAQTELPPALADKSGGVPPKVLAGGLAVAAILFLVVIFGLPAIFDPSRDSAPDDSTDTATGAAPAVVLHI